MRVDRSFSMGKSGFGLLYSQLIVNCWKRWLHMPAFLAALAVVGLCWGVLLTRPAAAEVTPIRTMSYNIRVDLTNGFPSNTPNSNSWVSNLPGESRRDLVLDVINNFSPDILGLQEARPNQVTDLRNGLPDSTSQDGGIFYRTDRFTKTDEGLFWLSNTPDVPGSLFPGTRFQRIASWVILEDNQAGGQEYFVLNTHWDHEIQAARVHSAQLIRERIEANSGGRPVILIGDLNLDEANSAYSDLLGANDPSGLQLFDSYREVVPVQDPEELTFQDFTNNITGARIDFVLQDDFFTVDDASIVRTSFNGSLPSDHYAVTAVLHGIPEPSSLALVAVIAMPLLARRRRARG